MESSIVIGILGIGLIGGSMALGLRKSGWAKECIGIDTNRPNQKRALELGLIDRLLPLDEALQIIDVLIIATPVDNLVEQLPKILDQFNEKQIVIEVGHLAGVRIKPDLTGKNSGEYGFLGRLQTDGQARLQDRVTFHHAPLRLVQAWTIERMGHGAYHFPNGTWRQLRIGIKRNHVADRP